MTTVVNLRHEPYDVYIGRGSPFGNPYITKTSSYRGIRVRNSDEAIWLYRLWLTTDVEIPGWRKPTHAQILALRGKRLGCYCRPQPCHGDVLVALIEELA